MSAFRINVKNFCWAKMLTDTTEGCTYETTPTKIPGLMSVDISPTMATGELYGDGAKVDAVSKITGYAVTIALNKLPLATRAAWLGHKLTTDGVMVVSADDQPIDIAIGYESEETGDNRELTWLLKGKAAPGAKSDKQSEGNVTYSTDTITINFVARIADKRFEAIGDTENPTFTSALADKFLNSVPTTFTMASE